VKLAGISRSIAPGDASSGRAKKAVAAWIQFGSVPGLVPSPKQTGGQSSIQIHDPTTLNRQGNDIGTSYRSAILYLDEEQRRVAEETIADVDTSGHWPGEIVTLVTPAGEFLEAEPEHQDYLERNPHGYTCHFVRPDWVLPQRTKTAGG
jgi:peptide methionine sulfoxide reductase